MTFSTVEIIIEQFVKKLKSGYTATFGGLKHEYAEIIGWAASMALNIISQSDALYHNVEHTVLVYVNWHCLRCVCLTFNFYFL